VVTRREKEKEAMVTISPSFILSEGKREGEERKDMAISLPWENKPTGKREERKGKGTYHPPPSSFLPTRRIRGRKHNLFSWVGGGERDFLLCFRGG